MPRYTTLTHGCPRPLQSAECWSSPTSLGDSVNRRREPHGRRFRALRLRSHRSYEAYVGRWSRPLAEAFLAWFAVPTAGRWFDVGCGTGALTEAVLDVTDPIAVVGIDPSPEFLGTAQSHISDPRARFELAGAAPSRCRATSTTR